MSRPSRLPELLAALDAPGVSRHRHALVSQFGQAAFDQARASGTLSEMFLDVYAHSTWAHTDDTRRAAASAWVGGRGALSGAAACAIYGLVVKEKQRVTIVVGHAQRLKAPSWLRVRHLTRTMPTLVRNDLSVVVLPVALIQAWWDEGVEVGRDLMFDAVRRRRTTTSRIIDALKYFPRLSNRKELLRFLSQLSRGIRSFLEDLADSLVLTTPTLKAFDRQVDFTVAGKNYCVDAFDKETRTAIEFDGAEYHSGDDARRRDIERDVALASIGVLTLRFTYEDITRRPAWCRTMIERTIASRQPAAA